jgi:flavin-dependent dehydrogenase
VYDVVVAGGGPAGSVCAAVLASRGRRVLVLERDRHPRFHLGESLLPDSLDVLEAVGVLEEVRARFLVKRGARFLDAATGRDRRYAFADAFQARRDHAFQVPRDEFDELLFRRAGACGAELREGWSARRLVKDAGRATGIDASGPDGQLESIPARFVVDATGRDALVARASGVVSRIAHLDRTAVYTQVRGAWRDDGEREGDIQIVVFGGGDARGWLWLIPFADGRTSVGAVVSKAWLRAHDAEDAAALLDAAVSEAPAAAKMLEGVERVFAPRATADFSFRVSRVRGDGWLAIGDAGGFLDPLFSTGVHLALRGALRAAEAIDVALSADNPSSDPFDAWEKEIRSGTDLFLGAVQAFYTGDLVDLLFADAQHAFLRRVVTSMLSGDVFSTEARWTREMTARFPARP